MKHKPKQLTPEEAVEFIDREYNPRLTEHRFNFASGAWVMTTLAKWAMDVRQQTTA